MIILLIALGYGVLVTSRPFTQLHPDRTSDSLSITTTVGNLPWPAYGEGAFGISDGKVIATHGDQIPLPTASAAKVITALVVLQKYPLKSGQSGPTITLGSNDVAIYNNYIAAHGSVMTVSAGMQLTELQMLQAMLLPSANNVADSLATWAYGSLANYRTAATTWAGDHDLNDTTIGSDASGLSPDTLSSASDLVKVGALAMQNDTIASIVGQKVAVIPGVGMVHNYNTLLGNGGIVGIKTGNSDQNPGVFMGAATTTVNGKQVTIISALSGAPNLATVLRDSNTLLTTAKTTIANTTIIQKGDVLGTYTQPNGTILQAVAANDLSTTVLRGDTVNATISLHPISYSAHAGQVIGSATLPATEFTGKQSTPITLRQMPDKPTIWFRLMHPFGT